MYGGSGTWPAALKTCSAISAAPVLRNSTDASMPSSSPSSSQKLWMPAMRTSAGLGPSSVSVSPTRSAADLTRHRQTWPTTGSRSATAGSLLGASGLRNITSMPPGGAGDAAEAPEGVPKSRAAKTRDSLNTRCTSPGSNAARSAKRRSATSPRDSCIPRSSRSCMRSVCVSSVRAAPTSGSATSSRELPRGSAGSLAMSRPGRS
mmetsp:Transcript_8232/g.23457  ORF Transcript_8232/g.23457 Transcript_8232/m.23457 type:complete len:205 (+) Transcript_8232:3998-4612(+)